MLAVVCVMLIGGGCASYATPGRGANMSALGVTITSGVVSITDYHLVDATHADRIKGTVTAGGTDGAGNGVSVTGSFDAPYCPEED
jgi:hypothetical protein